jgi:energy-coupling factor transport system ATP-binding protein
MNKGRIAMEGEPFEIFVRDQELEELGLDAPFTINLAHRLRARGVDIPDVISEEEMVEELCQYLSNN